MGRKRICIFSLSFPKAISRLTSPARNFPAAELVPTHCGSHVGKRQPWTPLAHAQQKSAMIWASQTSFCVFRAQRRKKLHEIPLPHWGGWWHYHGAGTRSAIRLPSPSAYSISSCIFAQLHHEPGSTTRVVSSRCALPFLLLNL